MLVDFPNWFIAFFNEQLKDINLRYKNMNNNEKEMMMIIYIKQWGIIESFSKIIYRLYQKRIYLLEIKPKLEAAKIDEHINTLTQWKTSLSNLIQQYEQSINTNAQINLDDINKSSVTLDKVKAIRFSVEKRDISKMKLPSKEDFEKALSHIYNTSDNKIAGIPKP